jgi:hypothetical protein
MRAFLVACFTLVVLGTAGYFFLTSIQDPAGFAFSTESTRITPVWSWRSVGNPVIPALNPSTAENCKTRESWQWFFVDFGSPAGEPEICSVSQ